MNWQQALIPAWHKLIALGAAIGLTGSGIGIIKFLKHVPAPYQDEPWKGAIFDTAQDLVSNSRIGERRTRAGVVVPPVPAAKEVPPPVAAPLVEEHAEIAKEEGQ